VKQSLILLGLLAVLALALTTSVQACPGCCGHGGCGMMKGGPRFEGGPGFDGDGPRMERGRGPAGGPLYNPASEKTLEGKVVRVEVMRGKRGPRGVLVWMEGKDDEFMPVHLGPAWFLKDEDIKVEKGDRLIVRGSEIPRRGGPVLLAKEFKKQDRLVTLRDDDGIPKWSRPERKGE
jgi:hypothetical protein